jgi:hypothetical protein
MQKKFALAAVSACLALAGLSNANAQRFCPFTDHFIIEAPLPLEVLKASVTGNLTFTKVTPNYFRLSCGDGGATPPGDLTVEIGMSEEIKCTLVIHDGPMVMNPSVTYATCGGPAARIYFLGMDHPQGSYDYKLKFTM